MKRASLTAVLFWVLCPALPVLAAEVPADETSIPIYPGAAPDAAGQAAVETEQAIDPESSSAVPTRYLRVYGTNDSPEEVFAFYLKKLGGTENAGGEADPASLAPGEATAVAYRVTPYLEEFGDLHGENDVLLRSGAWVRSKLEGSRKPYRPEEWISYAGFEWYRKGADDGISLFTVMIQDKSFSGNWDAYKTRTWIIVTAMKFGAVPGMEGLIGGEMDTGAGERTGAPAGQPLTEADLGAPIYPSSIFDAGNSAGMSEGGDYAYYIYLTEDTPQKVVGFYQEKLGKKPGEMGGEMFMFALKGSLPVPEEGISIQPNTLFGGTAKTVITFQLRAAGKK